MVCDRFYFDTDSQCFETGCFRRKQPVFLSPAVILGGFSLDSVQISV